MYESRAIVSDFFLKDIFKAGASNGWMPATPGRTVASAGRGTVKISSLQQVLTKQMYAFKQMF